MPFDATIVAINARRWHGKQFVSLPCEQCQPVLWVDDTDRLAMYHPALQLPQEGVTVPHAWTSESFARIVAEIRLKCAEAVRQRIDERGYPDNFYGTYVAECQRLARLSA